MQAITNQANDKRAHAEPITIHKRVGSIVYEVIIHFNQDAKETMHEKTLRLMRHDLEAAS